MKARVYTETTLYAAAAPFEKETPFQIAIVEFDDGARKTVRVEGPRVRIGDQVEVEAGRARLLKSGTGRRAGAVP